MGKTDPRVDAYIAKSADFAKPILKRLRTLVHKACPGAQETMKWSFPHFDYKGMMCSMAAFTRHCAFGFWKASLMKDPARILTATEGMGHLGKITALKDLPSDTILISYIKKAAKLNDEGVKIARANPATRKPVRVPADLARALKKSGPARRVFRKFPPSHKREYIEWITEAKRPETREKRVATTVAWLARGKSRNWKYT